MAVSVELGAPLEDYLNTLVKSGRYRSRSEVLREGVRLVQEREARVAALIDEGQRAVAEGRTRPAKEAFAELKAEIANMGQLKNVG